ncbi:formate-DH-alph: formate dehydrogenase, alpha subunit [Lysobacter silvestris]|uniref:Formate-DH-alph: formate dehydrogenase, alpha subunit n=3 Tax=Solilutibacter silvestris TaxID=1645665 RepID=A0A2K1Q391_9GAMM|nr:formate-DH-alph: formate dehydrogenase, alpha subunit [Lysobacter silvestris]
MTNHWVDIKNADLVLIMGGNAAEAHPCGFKWVTEAKAHNKARLIVIDPRFNRSAAVADVYAPIRAGTDIVFLGGLINYLLTQDKIQHEYVKNYTDMSFIVKDEFAFKDGLYSGYDPAKRKYDKSSWDYVVGADGFVKTDPTLQDPRCVYNLLKEHYARYTVDMVERVCGTPADKIKQIWEMIASTSTPNRAMTILYALGWTQHSVGAQNVRIGAMVQLLLGNIGIAGGGMNALRGHSNIQGLTDIGLMSNLLPGYLTLPNESEQDYQGYIGTRTQKPMRPNQMSYWQNYPKFHVSLMKSWWGDAATKDNNWCYDYLPKLDKPYDMMQAYELMAQGKMNGYLCQGFNPLASAPNKGKLIKAFSALKFMVHMDPLSTETMEFWKNYGEFNDVDSASIKTEVFRLPTTCFAEENGSVVNSSRWLQWHWKGADAPGEARSDLEIMSELFHRIKALYAKDGGTYPDPIRDLAWKYSNPESPTPEEVAMEFSGKALADVYDPKDPTKVIRKAGEQLAGFAELRDDGSTASGVWIFCGAWGPTGNLMARRDNSDPTGIGNTIGWAWAWPANRRVLYNRASCDPAGKPWDPKRKLIGWNGTAWGGADIPDFKADENPDGGMGPFIMNPEGTARFFARGGMNEGPFPEHYEPFDTPLAKNPLSPEQALTLNNPAARVFKDDAAQFGKPDEFPHVGTTYRLTEHFHFWTKHSLLNAIVQPEQFVEIGAALADELGIANGSKVKVSSKRGHIFAVAMVTKRIKALKIEGKTVHQVGVPIHWGFLGETKKGYLANTLTNAVGDANSQTPESKCFLVKVEKA